MTITLDRLLTMTSSELMAIVAAGAPLDLEALADSSYTGVDLSMPSLFHRLAWRSFRKTFHRDPVTGVLRGWNVMVEQTGWASPPAPRRDRQGRPRTFGHYEVRAARGLPFPRGWRGAHYLDYRFAGNHLWDVPARWGYCPLVAVEPGRSDLLLGWEVFRVAGVAVPIPDFWALQREGPLAADDIVARPDRRIVLPPPRG